MTPIYIGCFLAVVRYVLDDNWNILPEWLCRFCAGFWMCVMIHIGVSTFSFEYTPEFFFTVIGNIAVSVACLSIAYTYLKTSN